MGKFLQDAGGLSREIKSLIAETQAAEKRLTALIDNLQKLIDQLQPPAPVAPEAPPAKRRKPRRRTAEGRTNGNKI